MSLSLELKFRRGDFMSQLLTTSLFVVGLFLGSLSFGAHADEARVMAAVSPEMESAVNTQVKHELEAAYFYLGVANHFEKQGLFGFSHWFTVQFYEELTHARLMMKFLADKGNEIRLETLQPTPIRAEATALDIAQMGLKAEEEQTGRIHRLYAQAREAKAYDLESYMAFFVREQIQEEANFSDLTQKLKIAGGSAEAILALDRDLAKRVMPVVQPLPPIAPPL